MLDIVNGFVCLNNFLVAICDCYVACFLCFKSQHFNALDVLQVSIHLTWWLGCKVYSIVYLLHIWSEFCHHILIWVVREQLSHHSGLPLQEVNHVVVSILQNHSHYGVQGQIPFIATNFLVFQLIFFIHFYDFSSLSFIRRPFTGFEIFRHLMQTLSQPLI